MLPAPDATGAPLVHTTQLVGMRVSRASKERTSLETSASPALTDSTRLAWRQLYAPLALPTVGATMPLEDADCAQPKPQAQARQG